MDIYSASRCSLPPLAANASTALPRAAAILLYTGPARLHRAPPPSHLPELLGQAPLQHTARPGAAAPRFPAQPRAHVCTPAIVGEEASTDFFF